MVSRHEGAKISAVDFTACWMCSVGLSIAVGVSLVPMATFEGVRHPFVVV